MRLNRRVLLVVLSILSLLMTTATPLAAADDMTLVTVLPGRASALATDGEWLVASVAENPDDLSRDVLALDLSSDQQINIATGGTDQGYLGVAVDSGIVLWTESDKSWEQRDIRGKHLATGDEFTLAATSADETNPLVTDNWAVWSASSTVENGTQHTLLARAISTMAERVVLTSGLQEAGTSGRDIRPRPFSGYAVSGNRAGWIERAAPDQWPARLVIRDLITGEQTTITESARSFDLHGDTVVYNDLEQNVVVVDLLSGEARTVATGAQSDPVNSIQTDGRFIVWGYSPFDYGAYDLETASSLVLSLPSKPMLANGTLVWTDGIGWDNETEIHAAAAEDFSNGKLLRYFPETGQYLALGFLAYWEQSGGLPVFGYPLTAQSESGQCLERQCFQYHPELRGTPYEVLLTRAGDELAWRYELKGTEPFQSLSGDTGSDEHCTFFSETGRRLCHGFRDYWRSHGLEFGDADVSYRESLALFGYPISEEYTDPASGLTVQYFERARFEYHPDNPAPYKILLGRLGAELLATEPS